MGRGDGTLQRQSVPRHGGPDSCQATKLQFIVEAMANRRGVRENTIPELSTFCLNDGSEVETTESKKISESLCCVILTDLWIVDRIKGYF